MIRQLQATWLDISHWAIIMYRLMHGSYQLYEIDSHSLSMSYFHFEIPCMYIKPDLYDEKSEFPPKKF